MKLKIILQIFACCIFFGCKMDDAIFCNDFIFLEMLNHPRDQEIFYYVGSKTDYDYFVSEQQSNKSLVKITKLNKKFYKIPSSCLIKHRFMLTNDSKKWEYINIVSNKERLTYYADHQQQEIWLKNAIDYDYSIFYDY